MLQSNLIFDPQKGLQIPDSDQVLKAVQEEFKKVFGNNINLDPSSPQGQLITSLASMIITKNTELLKLANQFNPLTAQGIFQEALGRIYFLERKVAQPTIVFCECKGLQGTIIPNGAIVENTEGLRFYSTNQAIIAENQKTMVEFICEKVGEIPVKANTITKIITVISGWDTVNNPKDGIIGRIEESQAEFERRRYTSVAKNAHGTVASLYGALVSINDVIDVIVLENRTNNPIEQAGVTIDGHSVYISIFGGKEEEIAKTIYHKLDAGCGTTGDIDVTHIATDYGNAKYTYQINRPQELPLYIKIRIKETETTPATIVDDIKNAVLQNFNGLSSNNIARVRMAENLYASRFYCTILAQGVQELIEVLISNNNSDFNTVLYIPANKFPTLSANNITVILEKKE